jgi:hypothetical protein
MPHRNRTLMMVVSLIWIVALLGTFLSAQLRSGGQQDDGGQAQSAVIVVEAPAPATANSHAGLELPAPGDPLA